jgi:hypothetical protein
MSVAWDLEWTGYDDGRNVCLRHRRCHSTTNQPPVLGPRDEVTVSLHSEN